MGRRVLTSKSKRAARRVRVEDVLADLIFRPQCLAEYARLTGRAYDVRIATALREDLSKNGTLASHRHGGRRARRDPGDGAAPRSARDVDRGNRVAGSLSDSPPHGRADERPTSLPGGRRGAHPQPRRRPRAQEGPAALRWDDRASERSRSVTGAGRAASRRPLGPPCALPSPYARLLYTAPDPTRTEK